MKGADVLFSSASPEWLTPLPLLNQIKAFFGGVIDLDPSADADCNVPAERYFDQEKDGLKQPWKAGTVYLNPPYGRQIGHWTRKLLFERPNYREAITLLPARVDTKWWFDLMEADPVVCFIRGRLKFVSKQSTTATVAPFPSALVYIGTRKHSFADCFEELGTVFHVY